MIQITHPAQLEWHEGELPDVHTVPYRSQVLAFFHSCNWPINGVITFTPYKDSLNTLKWVNGIPVGGWGTVFAWAWLWSEESEEDEKLKTTLIDDPSGEKVKAAMKGSDGGNLVAMDTIAQAQERIKVLKEEEHCELYAKAGKACLDGDFTLAELQDIVTVLSIKEEGK